MSSSAPVGDETPPKLSIIFAYYENPEMLEFQLNSFGRMPASVREKIEVIVVDDASPTNPALAVAQRFPNLPLRVFRIKKDKPWNQDAARNIGAYECQSNAMLLTDVDHVATAQTLRLLLAHGVPDSVYSLGRQTHFTEREIHSHINSYFLSKNSFWALGGYDEDFWGTYGTDVFFRKRLNLLGGVSELEGAKLGLVTQGSIADAKTRAFSRTPTTRRKIRSWALKILKAFGLTKRLRVLSNPYEQVFPPSFGP